MEPKDLNLAVKKIYPDIQDSDYEIWCDNDSYSIKNWKYKDPQPTIQALEAKYPEAMLDKQRQNLWEKVKQIRAGKMQGGVLYNNTLFQTDDFSLSRVEFVSSAMTNGFNGPSIKWITAANDVVDLSLEDLKQIGCLAAELVQKCIEHSVALRKQIFESEEPGNIDIESGWPISPFTK